jgi:uncharacterized protein YjbJ (UPF0337 family)
LANSGVDDVFAITFALDATPAPTHAPTPAPTPAPTFADRDIITTNVTSEVSGARDNIKTNVTSEISGARDNVKTNVTSEISGARDNVKTNVTSAINAARDEVKTNITKEIQGIKADIAAIQTGGSSSGGSPLGACPSYPPTSTPSLTLAATNTSFTKLSTALTPIGLQITASDPDCSSSKLQINIAVLRCVQPACHRGVYGSRLNAALRLPILFLSL